MTAGLPRTMLLASAAVALLAGCGSGSGPHLARTDVAPLIELADRIAHESPCAQARDIRALDRQRVALLNAGKVPRALQEPLSSGVNALVAETPPCLPALPAVASPSPSGKGHDEKPHHGHGHGHGEGD